MKWTMNPLEQEKSTSTQAIFGASERNKLNVKKNTKENQLQFYTIFDQTFFSHFLGTKLVRYFV